MIMIFIGCILITTSSIVASAIPIPSLSSIDNLSKRSALPSSDLDRLTNFDFNFPQFNALGVCPPSSMDNHNLVSNIGGNQVLVFWTRWCSMSSIPGLGGSTSSVPGLGG
ncbi:hypothetical protein BDF22DRAFT_667467 [Syncephalis plumigaleata]|nr:hypothetical protein BDF22DRAFT_667467 [Syncephalis plumigaleata]